MLRETLSINKNLLTGESVIKTKYKPNNGTMGKVTVQLFNENGLVNETHTENIICHGIDKLLMKAYFDAITTGTATINTVATPFNQLQLRYCPDVKEESDRFPLLSGTALGYVDGETSTADATSSEAGRFVPAESFTVIENGYFKRRRVYEFGASQANGSIDSVCYMPKVTTGKAVEGQIYTIKNLANSAHLFYDYKNRLIKKASAGATVGQLVLNEEEYFQKPNATPVLSEETISFIDKKFRLSNGNYLDFTHSNTPGKNGSCKTIININVMNEEQEEPIESISFDLLQTEAFADIYEGLSKSTSSSAGMRIEGLMGVINDILYIKVYAGSGSSSTYVFPTVTENGIVTEDKAANLYTMCAYDLKTKEIVIAPNIREYRFRDNTFFGLPESFTTFHNLYEDGSVLLVNGSTKCKFHPNKFFEGAKSVGSAMTTANIISFNDETNMLLVYSSASSNNLCTFLPFNSFTKLPVPIVKDNTSSMKVTYDLYFEFPKMFAAPNEAFTWKNGGNMEVQTINTFQTLETLEEN